jgi:glycerol-3-phosphate acyltransferase PlsX
MSAGVTIALDAMGGDSGSSVVVPAAIAAITQHADANIILVGDETELTNALKKAGAEKHSSRLTIHHASQ